MLVDLHSRLDIKEASLRIRLRKDSEKESLFHYMRLFRKFL
jgi:hypothetical protein